MPPSLRLTRPQIYHLLKRKAAHVPAAARDCFSPSCSDKLLFKYKSRNKTHASLLCSAACSIFDFRKTAAEVTIIKALKGKSSLRLPDQKKKKEKRKPFYCLSKEKGRIVLNQLLLIRRRRKPLSCTSSRNIRQGLMKSLPIHQGLTMNI